MAGVRILVTGASGNTGRRVVAALARHGAQVCAYVRRQQVCSELEAIGAQDFSIGVLEDDAALQAALAKVDQVLHICPPMHLEEDKIARRLTDFCRRAGISRLIVWSVLHPCIDVPHHRRKLEAEKYLIESGQPYTILQPARYMQHLLPIWNNIVENGVHAMPFSTKARFSLADLADLAEAAAIVATQDEHLGATYQLAGMQPLSQEDCANILSEILARPVRAEARSLEDFRVLAEKNGMPAWRLDNMLIMNRHYDAHGLIGNGNVLRWIVGRAPCTFEDFVRRELHADLK